ncbi:MAG: NnrS family protein [Xanthobacteraceae bacterium]|nr:NnrS family protein [Xanthobacteraceae bacterium]
MSAFWSSGFRPFFLFGAAYGPLVQFGWFPLLAGWAAAGAMPPPGLWHGHELVYGFAAAFVCGFVLTALPSWAGTPEVAGPRLVALALVWLAGRAAAWSYAWLPPGVIAALDLLLFAALAALVLPGLVRALDRRYLALLPILAAFIAADAIYHLALARGDFVLAERALLGAVNVLVLLFAIVAGLLTPTFTQSELERRGLPARVAAPGWLEVAAVGAALVFAAADWLALPPAQNGAVACAAAAIHAARLAHWRTRSIRAAPLVLAMHAGYAWLVAAMALRGLADVSGWVPRAAWIHAFTVGALGMMMLAFLNRVSLRHTGRIAAATRLAGVGLAVMFAAGIARVATDLLGGDVRWMAVSGVLWALPFALFLAEHGAKLLRPSLPRDAAVRSAFEP